MGNQPNEGGAQKEPAVGLKRTLGLREAITITAGTVIGVLFYGVLSAGFTSLHMSQYLQWVVMGAIMLFALSLDVLKGKGVKLWKRK